MIESLARVPVEVDYASEFRYRDPIILPDSLFIFITQSGETADTISAQRLVRESGSKILTITNVVGSMTTRIADACLVYARGSGNWRRLDEGIHHTTGMSVPGLALHLGKFMARLPNAEIRRMLEDLKALPQKMEEHFGLRQKHGEDRQGFCSARKIFFSLHAVSHYPIALEGALKLKELSYIHAEGYPAGEMKHGPNALIDENLPVVFLRRTTRQTPTPGRVMKKSSTTSRK